MPNKIHNIFMFILRTMMAIIIMSWILGMFIPSVDCWNKAGTQIVTTEDSVIKVVRHSNCKCDSTIYLRKR